ncbi:MAG TPA: HEAT repeat domain-containing protein, partial [Cryomorphaceae bacterium]|nr:HEAT repeat domain-containing protein [Cryomorphaceae bacterium]
MSTTKNKKVEALMSLLHSTKSTEVIAALKKIPDQGNASLVKPLLRTYLAWPDDADIQARIEKILGELKTQEAVPELINALETDEFDSLRAM